MSSKETSEVWEMEIPSLEAKEVYVVMQNNYRISRNIRAQWFFKNLNKTLTFKWKTSQEECSEEIEIISAIPKHTEKFAVDPETNTSIIKIVSDTKIHFLSTQYRLAFCLDLSNSISTVDIQHDDILYEETFLSLEQSLTSVSKPFVVPGSDYYFSPQIYITVIAHIPNCSSTVPQALIQGWILTSANVPTLLSYLRKKLEQMCKLVEKVSSVVSDEQIQFMMSHDAAGAMLDSTIEGNKMIKKVLDLSADISTLKLIRYGMLALQLLPENSSAGIVVITDGILNFPTCKSLDSILTQLRNSTTSCSFIQLGSPFHSFSCFGRVPYKELMEFFATATCGAYFPSCKNLVESKFNSIEISSFHKALLLWSFQKTSTSGFLEAYDPSPTTEKYWHVENPHFYTVAHQSRVKKKHTEGTWKVNLENLLSCRIREGYSVKSVLIDEAKNTQEICLVLPWMLSTNIEYLITSGPIPGRHWKNSSSELSSCHFEIIVDGCYEFLHDVTCSDKKPIRSVYRKTVITQFWSYIKNLSNTDQILTQLHSFALNPMYYTIPESIKNGVPLFYFSTNSSVPILQSTNSANMQFAAFWKPLCLLDINVWQKWMHAHRIGVILQHDTPLQKNLHLPNASGRYAHVQCRQAITTLNSLLSEESSFVLVENHSYINLLFDDPDKPPVSFYVIRVTGKPPCVVIRLAFLGGLPGCQRYKIVNDLREKILNLKLAKRSAGKDYAQPLGQQSSASEQCCCCILKKPVEKILIRYEKLPTNFLISLPDSQGNTRSIPFHQKQSDAYFYADALATLSKYLLQQRWIWTLQYESCTSLDLKSASKILYTLTRIRLQEGFHFSHSNFGIVYLVQEIPMEVPKGIVSDSDGLVEKESNCCVVQYVIFPPHTNTTVKDSISEEDDTELTEADGELQLIAECWIEPQYGTTVMTPELGYLNELTYELLPAAIHQKDMEVLKVLTTFEHLCSVCQKSLKLISESAPAKSTSVQCGQLQCGLSSQPLPNITVLTKNEQIDQTNTIIVPYAFNLMSLLPRCPQTQLMFSTLHEAQVSHNEGEVSGNVLFFEFLMENLKLFHDQEISLTLEDCEIYLYQILHRKGKYSSESSIPFPHPEFAISEQSLQNSSVYLSDCDICYAAGNKSEDLNKQCLPNNRKDCIPRWRCFVKGCSSSHIIITLVPATYDDLKKMYFPNICNKNPLENEVSGNANAPNTSNIDVSELSSSENPNCEEEQVSIENFEMNSLILPIFVYNCVSSAIVNQLVELHNRSKIIDRYENHVFECECHADVNILVHTTGTHSEDEVKKTVDVLLLKEHCSHIEKAFSKAFVYGVYRSLMNDSSIQKCDAIAAIDNICEESLLEIDITEFIFMICGHVKDFFTKQSVRQMHFSQESNEENVTNDENAQDKITEQDRPSGKSCFPMSILEKYQPCEELHQKHLSVKEKFSEIIQSFFKVIPSRPDYFFFCPVEEDTVEDASIMNDADESQEEDALSGSVVVFEGDNAEGELDKVSNVIEEDECSKSCFNTNSSVSSIGKDTEHSSLQDRSTFPPLIVHFSCSVRGSKQELKSCPLTLLPTCLNDIIKCLDPNNHEISLEDLRITLDMYCLTVPNDVENPEISRRRVYSTSFSSNSPVPEAESYKHAAKDDDNESNCSDIPTDTLQGGSLFNLPSFQREAVFRCIDKIKWLLQDEKVSIALNCYPITSDALDMVIDHVKSSKEKPCCIIKEIPLMFVYGSENSLDKFTQAFKRMSPAGYRLEEVTGRYYIVIDGEAEQKSNSEALLSIAQFNILKGIPHSDDGTELKRIAQEIKDTPVFHDKDFQRSDDHQGSEVENEVFSLIRDKIPQQLGQEEDSETEDGTEDAKPKARFRKTSVKRLGACLHTCQRKCNSSLWETERKKGRSKKASKCIACKRGIDLGTDVVNKDQPATEEVRYSEDTPPVEESTPDASFDAKCAQEESNLASNSRLKTSDSDDPTVDKDVEYGKFLSSNTEDGYDGDSSDSGSDDLINSIDTRRPVLPRFWLIMQICENEVVVYFHMRNRSEDDPELIQCKSVLNEVITIIAKICKEVNQILLLKSLWDIRMCDRLLVPEENEDLWKGSDPNRTLSSEDPDNVLEVEEKCLAATLKFDPGAFGCPIVWVTHFRLHHRLAVTATGIHRSCGMQALRSVLNTFSVNNRENMFVYQESSGKVFYIRLFEEYCDVDHQRNGDDMSLVDRYSSMQSLPTKGTLSEIDLENDFRPRVNSGASDSYRQDSISTTSASRKHQKCVAMYVHGIGEVGTDIRKDLVQVLQNRLNEGVLDQINMMFCRNPSCMLTPEDVQFIQNPSSSPAHELFYTLPVKLLEYAHAIHVYLRQNLLHFLYTPKYTDNRKETHFKVYWDNPQEWAQTDDNDIFIYHPQQALSRPGGKGITCVILSLVTGQRKPFHTLEAQSPNPSAYLDGLAESEHCDLTAISCYDAKSERSPGPVALVRYQLWHVGKDNIEYLKVQLKDAITHALWDLLLEYRALTSPTSEAAFFDDSVCYSEPTTPIRMRRSGLVNVDSGLQMKDLHSSVKLHSSKEMSSSVPDMTTKTHSSSPLLKDVPAFNFGNKGPLSAKPEFNTQVTNLTSQLSVPTSSKCDKRNLNPMFHTSLKSFLEFGDKLGCSNLIKSVHDLPSRHCINFVLKEITKIVKLYLRDLAQRVYIKTTDSLLGNIEYVSFDPTDPNASENGESRPGAINDLIMVGRNERQWRSYMGLDDFAKFHEICLEGVKSYQKHLTHICDHRNIESFPESIPSSPTFANKSASSITSSSPNLKGSNARSSEVPNSLVPTFVPRQRLFLVYVQDKQMTVYLYNWAQDLTLNFIESITRLVKWHHHRNALLNNIVLQKVGLFQGVEMLRRSDVEKSSKDSKSSVLKGTIDEPVQSTLGYVEQLVRSHAFVPKDSQSGSNSSGRSIAAATFKSSYVVRTMKNVRPRVPFHLSLHANIKDPVMAHGNQYLELTVPRRRDVSSLFTLWQTRGANVNYQAFISSMISTESVGGMPMSPEDRVFQDLKRQARLSHYCLTPLLFSPSWRHKVAPIRDHALEPLDLLISSMERAPEIAVSSRSRHSSGSSLKTSEFSNSGGSMTRMRRMSGAAGYPGSNQGSPKMKSKTSSDETWHSTVCHHYLQEYIQYLHTVGFVSLQTSETAEKKFSIATDEDKLSRSDSFSRHRNSTRGSPNYLIKSVLGGLLVFELGLNDPYAYGHLYTVERRRFHLCSPRCLLDNQFGSSFLDDIDKVIMDINLHSFTYDYHLRTIHSYISGRQLIFRHGYHLTSFLDDFIKYYQKVPTGARNSIFTGTLAVQDVNMSGDQLYNYIISHNKLYGMTVLRMVPVVFDSNSSIDTEFALVELSQQMASYKDQNDDTCKIGSFDVGILINQNTSDSAIEPNSLVLNFYIILTSQRELYPKQLSTCGTLGSFQTVRFGSSLSSGFSSRKTSTVSSIMEREKFESSGEESVNSTDSGTRTKKVSIVRGMCDEDVMYLGYYSSQETMMQQVLQNQADTARSHLKEIVEQAAFDCRRDFLWSSLLPRSLRDENSSKDHGLSSYAEFTELLEYVTVRPLSTVDPRLNPFMIMHISWYTTLASVLKAKYADSHREFVSPDNNSLYVAVTSNSCPDVFILLTVDTRANRSNLCLVFREPPSSTFDEDKSDKRTKLLQALIEDFVNACCFHLWTCILTP